MSCFLYMCQKGICAYLKFQIFFCRRHTRSSCDEILMGCPLCCARGWGGIECSCSLSFLLVASVGRHFDGNSFVGCFERNVAGCMFIRYLLMRDREGKKSALPELVKMQLNDMQRCCAVNKLNFKILFCAYLLETSNKFVSVCYL